MSNNLQKITEQEEEKEMSKKVKVFLTALLSILILFGLTAPSTAQAATDRPTTGTLTIHKLQYHTATPPVIDNNGLEITAPAETTPLEGVTFNIYLVPDGTTDTTTPGGDWTRSLKTDADGIASFENLPKGRYLVVEDTTAPGTPPGIEYFTPNFLVDIPMMNPDGVSWNDDVHVYPKNRLVVGHAELTKEFPDYSGGLLPLAAFSLYKDGGIAGTTDDTLIGTLPTSPSDGKLEFKNLLRGKYYFIETFAPPGYGLNKTPINFEVTYDNHDVTHYFTRKNFLYPTIDKSVTTIGNQTDTENFNRLNTWIIQSTIPGDIGDYESYVITDQLSAYLDYEGSLTVKVDGTAVPYTFTAPVPAVGSAEQKLIINILPSDLVGYKGKKVTIEFKTSINESAPMNDEIENEATIVAILDETPYTDVSEKPEVHTGGKKFVKVDETENSTGLAGAKFIIKNASTGFYLKDDWDWGAKADAHEFTSDDYGKFEVKGLAYGSYTLIETQAPTGYNLRSDVSFDVDKNSYAATAATITNSPTLMLPQTGGMGTIVFTVVGLGLMVGAVKLYKKDGAEE